MAGRKRAALVTGAASGIGAAIAARLEADGLDVLAVDRQPAQRGPGTAFRADLTTREGNRAAVDAALDSFGRIDVVVANAGCQGVGVTATALCPAYVRTPMVEKQIFAQAAAHGRPENRVLEEVILAPQAVKRLVEPEEVAAMAAFLVGPHGGSITGVAIPMDQGWTAR